MIESLGLKLPKSRRLRKSKELSGTLSSAASYDGRLALLCYPARRQAGKPLVFRNIKEKLHMPDWEDFVDLDNLRLAWNRVIRSTHGDTKDRLALRAFNLSLDRNLGLLADRLDNETYEPSVALKIYQPKRAGTLRTIPILTVSDRIVYQGICNIVARRSAPDIQMVANRQVFAHLSASPNSMFALQPWRVQYRRFNRALEQTWRRGNKWLVKTDIASFYDSVDHGLLVEILRDRWNIDGRLLDLLRICLRTWSPHVQQRYLEQGLPQGYEASDFLSTIFLYTVDRDMCGKGYDAFYRRYVDDIRMLLPQQDKALRALIDLDLFMKSVGLIVQTAKTTTSRIDSIDDQRDPQWGLLSRIDQDLDLQREDTQGQLRQIFFDAVREFQTNEFAESHLAFALGRLAAYEDVRDQVLLLLDRIPWRSSELTRYLAQFRGDDHTVKRLKSFVENHRVYGWHLTNCLRCLSQIAQPDDFYATCREWLLDTNLPWYQRLTAAEALSETTESVAFCDTRSESEQNVMVRKALLASSYRLADDNSAGQQRIIRKMLEDSDEEIKRTGLYFLLSHSELSWENFVDMERQVGSLRALIPDLAPPGECFIRRTFSDFFQVDSALDIDFESILGAHYNAARRHLRIAVGEHDTSPSRYVCRIDNFNILLTQSIYEHHLPGINFQTIEPVNNWNRREFRDLCPGIAGDFLECHTVRSNCAEPHPYSASLGALSEEVDYGQRNEITIGLRSAYRQFVRLFSS